MSLIATPFVGGTTDTVLHVISFLLLVSVIGGSLFAFWKLHELPVHKAKKTNKYHQIELVTILTWIGFFIHWVWVVAVIIAFTDLEQIIKGIRQVWSNSTPENDKSLPENNEIETNKLKDGDIK